MYTQLYRMHFQLPPFGAWQRTNHASVASGLPLQDVRAVLEVGGGLGRLATLLAARYPTADVLSIDISEQMHALASQENRSPNVRFACQDFLHIESRHDLIVSAGCWEFLPLDAGADAAARALEPGGTLIINTLRPTPFARLHARLYRRRYQHRIELHEPAHLVAALERRGMRAEWAPVNRIEGSYTLVARSPASPAARA